MRGLTRTLWPIRYKPLPDELLSSWLMRLAHGHGQKVQTFCNLIFGNQRQVWNRDIDRLGPAWLIEELAASTGTHLDRARLTTLRGFEGTLFRSFKTSGHLPWIQTLQMYHRKREGFGMQFCPLCLAESNPPYFRRSWRISFKTVCTKHQVAMLDRCPACQHAIAFHRIEMGKAEHDHLPSMRHCHACGFDLGAAIGVPPKSFQCPEALAWLCEVIQQIDSATDDELDVDPDLLSVYRYLASMMFSKRGAGLNALTAAEIGADAIAFTHERRLSLEGSDLATRHQILLQTAWLMQDPASRIEAAWQAKAVRYNHLIKDFEDMPEWYRASVIGQIERRPYTHRKAKRAPAPSTTRPGR